jgi:CheY-like chemotaxis protein
LVDSHNRGKARDQLFAAEIGAPKRISVAGTIPASSSFGLNVAYGVGARHQMNSATLLLLVEDDEAVRPIVEDALREGGFELEIAVNGNRALAILESRKDTLHGLITDINLGDGPDGWEIARRGRELIPTLPVVYMSGAAGHEWPSKGVPHSTLVAKPFAPAQLLTAISTLLNVSDNHL